MVFKLPSCNHIKADRFALKVCLVYPGSSKAGISSLALSNIYSSLNSLEGIICDIFFSDSKRSVFLNKELASFDVVGFSISFETQLFEVVRILSSQSISPFKEDRDDSSPFLFVGGICPSYNPALYVPIFDAIYLGEAEERLEEIFKKLIENDFQMKYFFEFDNVIKTDEVAFFYEEDRAFPKKKALAKLFKSKAFPDKRSCLCFHKEDRVFSDMFLIEISRGCPERCRFCVASAFSLPYREKNIKIIENEISYAEGVFQRVGLIGTDASGYSRIEELIEIFEKKGFAPSLPSFKVSQDEKIFKLIKISGQKTLTIAPEVGTDRLRFAINKKVKNDEFLDFVEKSVEAGIRNLRLYFLIGVPTETEDDLESIIDFSLELKEKLPPGGKVTLSVNPMIPKPFTPMQWFGMPKKSALEKKLRKLERLAGKARLELSYEKASSAVLQAVLSRGDDRVSKAVVESVLKKKNFKSLLRSYGLKFDRLYSRERDEDEDFCWEVADFWIDRNYLLSEYKKVYEKKASARCFSGCKACGICRSF